MDTKVLSPDTGVEIELTQGYIALVSSEDYEAVVQYKWYPVKRSYTVYAKRSKNPQLMHNFIMTGLGIDHINGNGLDNRRSNLRFANRSQNNWNYQKRKGKSQYKGVCPAGPGSTTWKASITVQGRKLYLGSFKIEEEAAISYDKAALLYFGEFANLNFPHDS